MPRYPASRAMFRMVAGTRPFGIVRSHRVSRVSPPSRVMARGRAEARIRSGCSWTVLAGSYPRWERLTALRIARIEAVAVLVSMPTPHRTWPSVSTST